MVAVLSSRNDAGSSVISSAICPDRSRAALLVALTAWLAICLLHIPQALADSKTEPAEKAPTVPVTAASSKSGDPVPVEKRRRTMGTVPTSEEKKLLDALAAQTSVPFVETQLDIAIAFLEQQHHIAIHLDKEALEQESIPYDTPVNLSLSKVSLYSVLNLMLNDKQLGFTMDKNALKVTTRQKLTDKLLPATLVDFAARDRGILQNHARLQKVLGSKFTVDFLDTPVQDALLFVQDQTKVSFFIDRTSIGEANIDLGRPVTLKLEHVSVREILNKLLEPSKLKCWIENEVVMIGVADVDDHRLRRIKARKQAAAAAERKRHRAK